MTYDTFRMIVVLMIVQLLFTCDLIGKETTDTDLQVVSEFAEISKVPGSIITLKFPNLSETATGEPAQCQIRIPENYTTSNSVPLLVWYSGGHGSSKVNQAAGIIDSSNFLIVALPYPKSDPLPRVAANNNTQDRIWAYQFVMLKHIKELFPNISQETRIVAGTSSGGHLIATGLSVQWNGFFNYFTGFAIHEGGVAPGFYDGNTKLYAGAKRKKVFLLWGDATEKYQANFMKRVVILFKSSEAILHTKAIPDAKHSLSDEGRIAIRNWIQNNFSMTNASDHLKL